MFISKSYYFLRSLTTTIIVIIDFARVKSEKFLIIFIVDSNKIQNHIMLSSKGNENGEKTTIGLISKKATLHDYNVKLPETF